MNISTKTDHHILIVGAHRDIIQSVLDFDNMRGAPTPSVVAIIGGSKKAHKFWFGETEILLPGFSNIAEIPENVTADTLLNIASANSAKKITEQFFNRYPEASGAHIFCENMAEQDALSLVEQFGETKYIAGPSGVGFLKPGQLKLGAIGGILGGNLNVLAKQSGDTAIVCSSGGMTNELIDVVLRSGGSPSFAVSFGGDSFPITSPVQWCLLAEKDPETKRIVFFGELGGSDEFAIAKAIEDERITKPVFAYIAGYYDVAGKRIQFGHAKALSGNPDESAQSKIAALKNAGAHAFLQYKDFIFALQDQTYDNQPMKNTEAWEAPEERRRSSLFTASADKGDTSDPFVRHALCTLLEKSEVSDELVRFTDQVYSLLVDHGAEPSGAVNTMITARAGKDMSASLATGILTVGDRFGGAINKAAETWYIAVQEEVAVEDLLETHKSKGAYLMGIGHKKYTVSNKDPRVQSIVDFARKELTNTAHLDFAESVAKRTVEKKANLILNVDGAVAAVLLDLLIEKESMDKQQIEILFDIEFFNSYFLIPRTVGFIANYLGQKRRDEGLFRLPEGEVFYE